MKTAVNERRPETQVRELARTIRERIQAERLPDGALFMTEAQLAAEYGTSRTVTREAVSRLQALGLLEGRKRKGLIVRRPDPLRLFQHSLPSVMTSPDDWRDLAQLRYALEVGAIELSIRNATDAQIARLAEVETALEQAVRKDSSSIESAELDLRFHSLILEMTGSTLVAGMQQVLARAFQVMPKATPTSTTAERICWEHRELLEAIRDRDVERARAMIRLQIRATLSGEVLTEDRPKKMDGSARGPRKRRSPVAQ